MNNIYHSEDVNHEGTEYRVQYHVDDCFLRLTVSESI